MQYPKGEWGNYEMEGTIMAIPALRSGGFGTSVFQRSNREAQQIGGQVTHEIMQQVKQAYATSHPVQNLGKNIDIQA